MICLTCREAAVLGRGTEGIVYQDLWSGRQETLAPREAAAKVHAACKGGTWCDCQHGTR